MRRVTERMPEFDRSDLVATHEVKLVSANKQMMCATFKLTPKNCEAAPASLLEKKISTEGSDHQEMIVVEKKLKTE